MNPIYEPDDEHLLRSEDPKGPKVIFDDWGDYGTGAHICDGNGVVIALRPDDVDELYKILTAKKEELGRVRKKNMKDW